jgi:hypothetical protein
MKYDTSFFCNSNHYRVKLSSSSSHRWCQASMRKAKIRSEVAHKELSDSTRSALCYAASLKPVVRLLELADSDLGKYKKEKRDASR